MSATGVSATPSEASLFLKGLFAGKPDDLHVLLWTLQEKQSHWFQDLDRAIRSADVRSARHRYERL